MYRGSDEKASLVGSYRLPTPECVPEETSSRAEETEDGRSRVLRTGSRRDPVSN